MSSLLVLFLINFTLFILSSHVLNLKNFIVFNSLFFHLKIFLFFFFLDSNIFYKLCFLSFQIKSSNSRFCHLRLFLIRWWHFFFLFCLNLFFLNLFQFFFFILNLNIDKILKKILTFQLF
jgi:hypothetical protein